MYLKAPPALRQVKDAFVAVPVTNRDTTVYGRYRPIDQLNTAGDSSII